jgi:hypothetical protein
MWSETDAGEPWRSCRGPAAKRGAATLSRTATMSDRNHPSDGPVEQMETPRSPIITRKIQHGSACLHRTRQHKALRQTRGQIRDNSTVASTIPLSVRCRRSASSRPPAATNRETYRSQDRPCEADMPDGARGSGTASAMSLPAGAVWPRADGTRSGDRAPAAGHTKAKLSSSGRV